MARQIVLGEIIVEHFARPVGERVEFQAAGVAVELEARQALARRRLEALAAGDRRVEVGERLFARLRCVSETDDRLIDIADCARRAFDA